MHALVRAVRRDPLLYLFSAVAVAVRVAFWVVTDRVWEDALITLASAHNAVTGLGLVHHAGEGHVYSFTSALSVLVPLIGEALHPGTGLIAMRAASLLAAVVACTYGYLICRRLTLGAWPTALVLAFIALDWNQVYYGMSGMETELAVAVILGLVYHLMAKTPWVTGLMLGLALLARPDFLLIVVPAVVYLAFRARRSALRETAVGLAVVAPWLVFTLAYYGSVVPNTIGAKAARYFDFPPLDGLNLTPQLQWLANRGSSLQDLLQQFMPFYNENSLVAAPLPYRVAAVFAVVLILLGLLGAWSRRRTWGWPVVIVYVALFAGYRVLLLPATYYTWYTPPFAALVVLAAGAGLDTMHRRYAALTPVITSALVVGLALPLVPLMVVTARVQRDIEANVRVPLGLYLRASVAPGEGVVSESAGYVGYYSGVRLYDYPGLTSPTAANALAKMPVARRSLSFLVASLRAPWVVLRPFEAAELQQDHPSVYAGYEDVAAFHRNVDLRYSGVELSNIDRAFIVFRLRR